MSDDFRPRRRREPDEDVPRRSRSRRDDDDVEEEGAERGLLMLPWIVAGSVALLVVGIIVAVIVATREPGAQQVAEQPANQKPAPVAPPQAPNLDKAKAPKSEAELKAEAERQHKAKKEAEAEAARRAQAQKKAAAWLEDCKTELTDRTIVYNRLKSEADQLERQGWKDIERLKQSMRVIDSYHRIGALAPSREMDIAKELQKRCKENVAKLKTAEDAARKAAAAVVEAEDAVQQAEEALLSVGGAPKSGPPSKEGDWWTEKNDTRGKPPKSKEPAPLVTEKTDPPSVPDTFLGRWKMVNLQRVVCYLVVTESGALWEGDSNNPGKVAFVGKELRITWANGFLDVLRQENGQMSFLSLGQNVGWDSPPKFRLRADRMPK